jgi:2-dehydro-3-deoxyphosphogluconate aldolase/(4S)-4-hydroxy-2-oxoglutarate aldolase
MRLSEHDKAVDIAKTLVDSGIEVLEVTIEHPEGLRSLERIGTSLGESVVLGAGTVINVDDVPRVRDAGARFIISPHIDPELVESAHCLDLLPIPGTLTASEVVMAMKAGARLIKLFPAEAIGVSYMRALRGPFAGMRFVATGGITVENAATWLEAGAFAVAMGSELVPRSGTLDGLAERVSRAVLATRIRETL